MFKSSSFFSFAVILSGSLAAALPTSSGKTITIPGIRRASKYHDIEGKVEFSALRNEIARIQDKYSSTPQALNSFDRRAVGTIPLGDKVSDGLDVGYYGPISVGTPPQQIREHYSRKLVYDTDKAMSEVNFDTGSGGTRTYLVD